MVADDSAIQTFLLQKSTLIDFVESDNMRCKCGCKWKLKRTLYEYTAGTFKFKCSNPVCKNTSSFTTQRRGVHNTYGLTTSQELKKEKVMTALYDMLTGCLVHDKHDWCSQVNGKGCACAINQTVGDYFKSVSPEQ